MKVTEQIQPEPETEASAKPEDDLEIYIGVLLKEIDDLLEMVKRG